MFAFPTTTPERYDTHISGSCVLTGVLRRSGSHTPLGNFSSKRGNKNFYKGRGGKKYGVPGPKGGFVLRSYPNWKVPDMANFRLKPYVWPGDGLPKPGVLEIPHVA